MAGTGGVVTSAGLVFAATMASMLGSSLIIVAQMGSTIAIGLLLDTPVVRSLLMPSIATLLGRWFWWPQVVYPGGDHHRPQPPTPSTDDNLDRVVPHHRHIPVSFSLAHSISTDARRLFRR